MARMAGLVLSLAVLAGLTAGQSLEKRSDDGNPLAAVVSSHSQALESITARLAALETSAGKRAWFTAQLPSTTVAVNAPVRFSLGSMIGGGYDANTGLYTAPLGGLYLLHYQLFAPDLAPSVIMDLKVNGNIVARSRCYDNDAYSTSCFAARLLPLKEGDKVWVQTDHAGAFYSGVHSFFEGVLLSNNA